MTQTYYEVQERMVGDRWENTWIDEDGMPQIFETEEQALQEMVWYLRECLDAVEDGYMEDAPDQSDLRVMTVKAQ
jgi:hypothetical protein